MRPEARIPVEVRPALDEFKAAVSEVLGAQLRSVVLFGSVARGQMSEESDVDLLVLVEAKNDQTVRLVVDAAVKIMLARPALVLSPLVLTTGQFDELRARERRLACDIDREGIPL